MCFVKCYMLPCYNRKVYTDDKCLAKENTALNIHNGQSLVVNGTSAHGPDVESQVNSDQGKDNMQKHLMQKTYCSLLILFVQLH